MKTRNLLFVALLLVCSFALTASHTEPKGKNLELRTEVGNYLRQANLNIDPVQSITINFLINSKHEIVIISTSNQEIESAVKNSLNYKTIKTSDFEVNTIYTLPIVIGKK